MNRQRLENTTQVKEIYLIRHASTNGGGNHLNNGVQGESNMPWA